jgi:hypothetical protein
MEYKEISKIVVKKVADTFLVTFNDGTKKKVRMWYDVRGVCIMNRKSRKWGHLLNTTDEYDKWTNLVLFADKDVDKHKRVVRRAKKVEKMLEESGLWANIKTMLHTFLYERNEEEQKAIINVALDYQKNFDEKDAIFYRWLFESLVRDRCFTAINWFSYDKEEYGKLLEERIKAKEDFKYFWHKGYDNRLSIVKDKNGMLCGYYSEEYTGCANGYYYILLDAKHALFCEKD